MSNQLPALLLNFRNSKKFHRFDPESGRAEPIKDSDGAVTIDDVVGFFDRKLVGLLWPHYVNVAIIFRENFVQVWIDGRKIQFDESDGDVCFIRSGIAPFVHEFVARSRDETILNSKYWWTDLVEDGFKTKDIFTYLANEVAASRESILSFLIKWKMRRLSKTHERQQRATVSGLGL